MPKFFKKLKQKNSNLHKLAVVVAVVLVWRGLWGIADLYFLPHNELLSFSLNILLGIGILLWIDRFSLKDLD